MYLNPIKYSHIKATNGVIITNDIDKSEELCYTMLVLFKGRE